MASKKKQMTFADRAKKIMKRYEARPDDKAAQESKNRELAALKEEQETYKRNEAMKAVETMQSMGYGNMLAYGGKLYADGGDLSNFQQRQFQDWANAQAGKDITGGYGWGPKSEAAWKQYGNQWQQSLNPNVSSIGAQNLSTPTVQGQLAELPADKFAQIPFHMEDGTPIDYAQVGKTTPWLFPEGTSKNKLFENNENDPGKFESNPANKWVQAAQLGADVYGLSQHLRKPDQFTSKRFDTNFKTDTTASEEAINKQMATQAAMQREGERNLGSAGAKQAAAYSGAKLQEVAGGQKAKLIQDAANRDAMINAQREAQNMQLADRDQQMNMQAEGARRSAIEQYLRNIGQTTVPGFEQDKRKQQVQDAIVNLMGDQFGYTGNLEDLGIYFRG